jgi:hypothetical protein
MLDLIGWIDGLTATGVVFFGLVFGLFFIIKSRKAKTKMLVYLGLATIFAGLMFLGVFLDFWIVLFTDANIGNPNGLVGILSYIWLAPAIITAIYIGVYLLIPKGKIPIMLLYLILTIAFEIIIFIDPMHSFQFTPPAIPATQLIDYNLNLISLAGIMMAVFLLSVLILIGIGFLIKAFQSTGIIRKKFILISLGSISFCVFGLMEGLIAPGPLIILIRAGYLTSFWLFYFGLKD